jgi:hypothetical protein
MWQGDETYVCFFDYAGGNPSMNADEIKAGGRYDVTIKLPPVPRRGTYELRYACLNRPYRGVCQMYLGLDRINRTGTTVVMATHDREMVDSMRKRVVALEGGHIVRDQERGGYGYYGAI